MIGVRVQKKAGGSNNPASLKESGTKHSDQAPVPLSSGRSSMTYNNPLAIEPKHEAHTMQDSDDNWFSKTAATGWEPVPLS